jgi:ABC-2 type transport system ATP-binding protein
MPGPPPVECSDLTKHFGPVQALEGLELTLEEGEVFGFLGPNGAGKTTTIRLLLDLVRPTRGSARILGYEPRAESRAVRSRVGYLPAEPALQPELTAREQIAFLADLRGGVPEDRWRGLARRLDLDLDRPVGDLSRGNVQKVALVQAFMHEPPVLILDEPTTGLDPLLQETFHELLDEAVHGGATVFLSSHVLSQVGRVADRVGILRDGRLVRVEDVHDLEAQALREVHVHFADPPPDDVFADVPGVVDVRRRDSDAWFQVEGTLDPLVKALAEHDVVSLTSHEADLEEVFRGFYEEA